MAKPPGKPLLVDPAIEIVLTDIGMPRLDGYGLLERLRASKLPRVRDLPVVIISGDEDESARERALALGATVSSPRGRRCRAPRDADFTAAPVEGAGRASSAAAPRSSGRARSTPSRGWRPRPTSSITAPRRWPRRAVARPTSVRW